jgi:hypothetical protein
MQFFLSHLQSNAKPDNLLPTVCSYLKSQLFGAFVSAVKKKTAE